MGIERQAEFARLEREHAERRLRRAHATEHGRDAEASVEHALTRVGDVQAFQEPGRKAEQTSPRAAPPLRAVIPLCNDALPHGFCASS